MYKQWQAVTTLDYMILIAFFGKHIWCYQLQSSADTFQNVVQLEQ